MKVVLLCGGKGMRLQERTATLPKPLVEIGGRPILWHVMKWYAHFGYKDFVLCLGYLGSAIKEYFVRYEPWRHENFTMHLGVQSESSLQPLSESEDWIITFADTGLETQTGGRLKRIESLLDGDIFLANYSDGLSDLDLNHLLEFHNGHGRIATLTAVRPRSQFGIIDIEDGRVTQFREKPPFETWINGGFFVFNRTILNYLDSNSVLESDCLTSLAAAGELMAYQHSGRWECMDTYKDTSYLNQLWESGEAFWKVW